jgi:hypothetical protein
VAAKVREERANTAPAVEIGGILVESNAEAEKERPCEWAARSAKAGDYSVQVLEGSCHEVDFRGFVKLEGVVRVVEKWCSLRWHMETLQDDQDMASCGDDVRVDAGREDVAVAVAGDRRKYWDQDMS